MDGDNGVIVKDRCVEACDTDVMIQIAAHIIEVEPFEVAFGDNPRCQGRGMSERELVDDGGLSDEDERQIGFGILFELDEGMQFGKDFQSQQGGLVDDQNGFEFFSGDEVFDFRADHGCHDGFGRADTGNTDGRCDLSVEFENGSGCGNEMKTDVFGGMKQSLGVADGGGFPGADFAGDNGNTAQREGIVEAGLDREQLRGFHDVLYR